MATVYIAPEIAEVIELHPYVDSDPYRSAPIAEQIEKQAETLWRACKAGDKRAVFQITCWWPGAAGLDRNRLFESDFAKQDAQLTISREHGFEGIESIADIVLDLEFESALDAVLAGDIDGLKRALQQRPDLVAAHSCYGHASTLLHYLGANGVETHRQRVPSNAAQVAELLISKGADITAEANMYGGGQTAAGLAETSAHPHNAGVAEALVKALS